MNTKDTKKAGLDAKSSATNADDLAQDWHPADVKAALHKAGWTLSALAHEHGLTSSNTLSKALVSSYPIAEKRIADALGLHPKDIWLSRYFDNGEVKPRGFHALQFNRIKRTVNTQTDDAYSHGVDRRRHDKGNGHEVDRRQHDRRKTQPKDSD